LTSTSKGQGARGYTPSEPHTRGYTPYKGLHPFRTPYEGTGQSNTRAKSNRIIYTIFFNIVWGCVLPWLGGFEGA